MKDNWFNRTFRKQALELYLEKYNIEHACKDCKFSNQVCNKIEHFNIFDGLPYYSKLKDARQNECLNAKNWVAKNDVIDLILLISLEEITALYEATKNAYNFLHDQPIIVTVSRYTLCIEMREVEGITNLCYRLMETRKKYVK